MNIQYLKKNFTPWLLLLPIGLLLFGCGEEVQKSLKPVPTAFGKINQLTVIADEDLWEGPVGDTLRYYYTAAYPILPQPEPIFDIRHFTAEELDADPMRKELRNYLIIANLNDENSPTSKLVAKDLGTEKVRRAGEEAAFNTTVGNNKWARGQLLIYQFGFSEDALINNLKENFPAIRQRLYQADKKKVEATVYLDGESRKLMDEVQEEMDAVIRVPNDYQLAISNGDVIWMRKETDVLSSNIVVTTVKYTDQKQLSYEGIKAIRDSIGRQYIASTLPGTYMRINDEDLPMLTQTTSINNNYALEARGIWEVENDYMGGAFLSYLIHNPNKENLLFVDGFVHAPGEDKRDYMLYLEHILHTTKF